MKTKNYFFLILACYTFLAQAQTIFKGTVVDTDTATPMINAKVGVTHQGVGVLTNKRGKFNYRKYEETISDTDVLIVGAEGYETIKISAGELRSLFNRNSTIKLSKRKQQLPQHTHQQLKIFWDISEGMQDRDLEEELAFVQRYLNAKGEIGVTLEVFNNVIQEKVVWKRWDGDMDRFRESVTQHTYNGPSNYSILRAKNTDAALLMSNGEANYGKLEVSQEIPVDVVLTNRTEKGVEFLKNLAAYTSGNVFTSQMSLENQNFLELVNTKVDQAMISGRISSLGKPLQGASIVVKGELSEYYSKADGSFEIPASDGDLLLVRALGMFPKGVAVGDDDALKIEMIPSTDLLDAVEITTSVEQIYVGNKTIRGIDEPNMPGGITSLGDFYITYKDITPNARTLDEVLREKFKGIRTSYTSQGPVLTYFGNVPAYFVNGYPVFHPSEALGILDSNIASIVLKDSQLTNIKYGGFGERGLQVLVTTKNDIEEFKDHKEYLAKNNDYKEKLPKISNGLIQESRKVSGIVSSLDKPIQNAEILRKGSFEVATTNSQGTFEISVKEGDVLIVNGLGMFPKEIAVNDASSYTIELFPKNDILDDVVLTAREETIRVGNKEQRGVRNEFAPGGITGAGDFYITAKDITPDAKTIEQVLKEKFKRIDIITSDFDRGPFITVSQAIPLWILDGVEMINQPPPFYISDQDIESIVVKDPGFQSKDERGDYAEKGFIIVTTKRSSGDKNGDSTLVQGNDYEEEIKDISETTSTITGRVTSSGAPLQRAEISKKGSFQIMYSRSDGTFTIDAVEGDIINVTALGMFSRSILITDQKKYPIDLLPNVDILDDVEIVGNITSQKELEQEKQEAVYVSKSYAPKVFTEEDIAKTGGSTLVNLLAGKFSGIILNRNTLKNTRTGAGYRAISYAVVVNGQFFTQAILGTIDPLSIKNVEVISGPQGAVKYGSEARNGVIVIDTIGALDSDDSKPKKTALVSGNDYEEKERAPSTDLTRITGTIINSKGPIKNATITQKGSFNEVFTGEAGKFFINSMVGEILVISAPAMFPKEVLIEGQDMGTIALTPKSNDLDAVVLEGQERIDNTVETAYGKTSGDQIGYATGEINSKEFSAGYTSLDQLIKGKVSGVQVNSGLLTGQATTYKIRGGSQSVTNEVPPIWIVNGTPYQEPPSFLDVNQIENISILKSVMATSRYGSLAAGGAFLIKTKEVDFKNKAVASNQSALISGNEYTGDVTGDVDAVLPEYIIRFRESGTPKEQLALYKKLSRTQESPLEYYVDAAQYFQSLNPQLGDEVRSDLAYIARNNTKALRTLAYLYELVKDTENVVLVNQRIAKIAPQEAQSYRDLALAYQNNRQFDKALELYVNMLGEQILGINFDGLEKPLRNELRRLVALHKDKIDFERLPNEWLRTDFKIDMRMVIDWSDRSVPFEFQFVNPDKKFFKWTHSLEETRDRLQAEQKQGFQTEEFIIDDAPSGEWLINIQYLGDEGDYVLPPFLKYTVYRNYGTPQETKETRVIKLFKQVDKVTLGRLSL